MQVICPKREQKYFCKGGWTGGIGLNPKENFLSAVIPRCAIAHLRAHLMAAHSKSVSSYRTIRRAFDERRCHFAKYRGRDRAQLSFVPRVDADQCAFQINGEASLSKSPQKNETLATSGKIALTGKVNT